MGDLRSLIQKENRRRSVDVFGPKGVRRLDHTTTLPDHSAGSDSATALVFTFRLRAASHRQMT